MQHIVMRIDLHVKLEIFNGGLGGFPPGRGSGGYKIELKKVRVKGGVRRKKE